MNTTEAKVTADPTLGTSGCYVIERERSYSTLGFDQTLDRIERYALNLYMDPKPVDALMRAMRPKRGEVEVYEKMRELERALIDRYQETGERAVAELTPQLNGMEGWRVEVVRMNGESARFIVGKSTGPIPCHLEVKRVDSMGGDPADKEYKSVRAVSEGRIR
jgi:hypothetical protein